LGIAPFGIFWDVNREGQKLRTVASLPPTIRKQTAELQAVIEQSLDAD